MSIEEILSLVDDLSSVAKDEKSPKVANARAVSLVELTGGEPLLQPDAIPLAKKLIGAGYTVLIETSGERSIAELPREVIKIVDVKCPDSGEPDTFRMENLNAISDKDEIKFVISSRRDYEFARDFVSAHQLDERVNAVLFSPAFSKQASGARDASGCLLDPRELAEWMLADTVPARLSLQIHKFVWDPAMKGV